MNGDDVNIYFMIPKNCTDENDCDSEMIGTFELCRIHIKKCSWINEKNWKQISKTKQDVVVFQQFEGDVFQSLVEEKCLILGYRCLKTCLLEKITIPNCPTPVYTIPMTNMVVCCSGIPPLEKKQLQLKIGYMGGIYSPNFTKETTHLVTNCVNSVKYAWAVELKIPVYLSTWVEAVWETNLSSTNYANAAVFDKHKCPPFYNLNVTSTGLSKKERDDVSSLINDNGGNYSGKFQSEFTKVLICRKGAASEKYHAAKKSKIECCTIEWIFDSAKVGYALPFEKYRIIDKDYASSTLINQNETAIDPNFSMASTIQGELPDISETRSINVSSVSMVPSKYTSKQGSNEDTTNSLNKVEYIMQNLPDLREIKKIGPFLDGCCVYLAGFPTEQREKLCKILNLGGAIRYDTISGYVTHLIAQDYATSEIKKFHEEGHCPMALSLEWIIESIKLKCPAPEEPYKLNPSKFKNTDFSPSSPLSKKGVQILRTNSSVSISKNNESTEKDDETSENDHPELETENDFMKEYFQKRHSNDRDTLEHLLVAENITDNAERQKTITARNYESEINAKDNSEKSLPQQSYIEKVAPLPVEDSTTNITDITETTNIFEDLKFSIVDWDHTLEEEIVEIITSCGGKVFSSNRIKVDYAIVPFEGTSKKTNANVVVTNFWVEECFEYNKLLPIKYYHKPVILKENTAPLEGCVISLSSYKNKERSFIHCLIQHLGARAEETLSKKDNRKGIPASTHLICPTPMGSKYTAAVRWGLHIVTEEWLLACASECERVPEHMYTLKESPVKDNTKIESILQEKNSSNSKSTEFVNIDVQNHSPSLKINDDINQNNEINDKSNERSDMSTPKSTKNCNDNKPIDDFSSIKTKKIYTEEQILEKCLSSTSLEHAPHAIQDDSKNQSINDKTNNKNTPKSDSFLSEKGSTSSNQYTPISTLQRFSKLFPELKDASPVPELKAKTPILINKLSNVQSPGFSQPMTPVAKFFENLGLPKGGTPDNSPLPLTPSHVSTPNTPLGRCFGNPNPSPDTRKYWAKRINALPSYHHTPPSKRPRLNSTPLSELKDRLWKKILPSDNEENYEVCETEETQQENCTPTEKILTPTKNPVVSAQIEQLKNMLQRRASEEGLKRSIARTEERQYDLNDEPTLSRMPVVESQADTIGWEDPLEVDSYEKPSTTLNKSESSFVLPRRFMLSQIATNDRQKYVELIESIGGIISDQITLFDESSTHLVCPVLSRNEKMLASVAAGKWVLHTSYLEDSAKAGHFLNEELYEYGNPLATLLGDVNSSQIAAAVYKWRTKINATKQRAYHGMRAIIFVKTRKDQLIRLIEAGGGIVINEMSFDETDATHCFVDPKQINDFPQVKLLATKGVYCLPPIYLSNVLIANPPLNPKDCIIPSLLSYYN